MVGALAMLTACFRPKITFNGPNATDSIAKLHAIVQIANRSDWHARSGQSWRHWDARRKSTGCGHRRVKELALTELASSAATGPLAGYRVLEFGTNVSAPFAAMLLGDQGADVIKVETAGGDQTRGAGSLRSGVAGISS